MPPSDASFPGEPELWHAPGRDDERHDVLALLALGEPLDGAAGSCVDHVVGCARCQTDLAALQHVVVLGRQDPDLDTTAGPSPRVWQAISSELALAGPEQQPPVSGRDASHRSRWRRRAVGLLAAAAVAVAGTVGGYYVGRRSDASDTVTATADLTGMPGGPRGVSGRATVRTADDGAHLSVTTDGLPLRAGFYEVWLFDPDRNQMVAVGTLGAAGNAQLPVPPGLDVRAYHVVDVSAQRYDGDPAHGTSVLRGGLTT